MKSDLDDRVDSGGFRFVEWRTYMLATPYRGAGSGRHKRVILPLARWIPLTIENSKAREGKTR